MYREVNPRLGEKKASSKEQILVDQKNAYEQNARTVRSKGFFLKAALVLLLVALMFLGISKLGGTSSISKRTTLGTIGIGGIQSGKETRSFEYRGKGNDRDHACTG